MLLEAAGLSLSVARMYRSVWEQLDFRAIFFFSQLYRTLSRRLRSSLLNSLQVAGS